MKYTTIKNIVWIELSPIEVFQLIRYRHIESTEFNSIPILFNRMEKIASIYTYVYTDNANVIIYWSHSQNIEGLQRRINSDNEIGDIRPVNYEHLNNVDVLTLIQKGLLIENEMYYISDFQSTYESFDSYVYTLDTESIRFFFDSSQLEEVLNEFYN
jgi:hypothetical protein